MPFPSAAIFARGTLLKIDNGAGTYTTIAEVKALVGPQMTMTPLDVSNHDSPTYWNEFIPGVLAGGDVTFTLNFQPQAPTHSYATGLIHDMLNQVRRNFQMVFTDSGHTVWPFTAFVIKFDTQEPADNVLTANVALRITGQITLA